MNEENKAIGEESIVENESITESATETVPDTSIEENNESEYDASESEEIASETSKMGKKLKKHDEALILVEKAKEIVKEADEQTEACKLLLAGDLKEYEEAKESLKSNGMDACVLLIKKLEDENKTENEDVSEEEENVIVIETKDELDPMYLKDVSSGKFTGLVYSLLGGAATVAGLFSVIQTVEMIILMLQQY